MKVLKILLIIVVVLLAIVFIPPFFMPSEMLVEQTRVMKASPEVVWDEINCLNNWEQWDMWHQDTNLVGVYAGPACGVGANNTWTYKNSDDGGSQTIVESTPYSYIKTNLDFGEMGTAESEFFIEPTDEGTQIKWNLKTSGAGIMMKWMNTLMIKAGVTKSYKQGLENLDKLTENMKSEPKYSTGEIAIKEVKSMPGLAVRNEVTADQIAQAMSDAYGQLMQYAGASIASQPLSIWYKWEGDTMVFDNVIPLQNPMEGKGNIKAITTYAGKALFVEHRGSYESTQYSWEALGKYMEENELESNGDPFEVYITDPGMEPDPSKWVTELYWPIK